MIDAHILSLVQSISAYWFMHERGTLSVAITAMATLYEACKGAPSSLRRVFDEASSVVPLSERHQHQAMRGPQKVADDYRIEASLLSWCVTQHDSRPISKT